VIEIIITTEISRHWTVDQMEDYATALDETSEGRIKSKVLHS